MATEETSWADRLGKTQNVIMNKGKDILAGIEKKMPTKEEIGEALYEILNQVADLLGKVNKDLDALFRKLARKVGKDFGASIPARSFAECAEDLTEGFADIGKKAKAMVISPEIYAATNRVGQTVISFVGSLDKTPQDRTTGWENLTTSVKDLGNAVGKVFSTPAR